MSKDFQDWEADQPGRNVTVGHPDYVPPAAAPAVEDPHAGMEHLSLTARRVKLHGEGGLSADEVKHAHAELRGKRIA